MVFFYLKKLMIKKGTFKNIYTENYVEIIIN
jgi:hypothetical protein